MAPRQTSDRVSRIAARVMRRLGKLADGEVLSGASWVNVNDWVTVAEVRALASCLNQDQTRGEAKEAGEEAEEGEVMSEQQKRPPCDACGAESCTAKTGLERASLGGQFLDEEFHFCATCWSKSRAENRAAIAARRAKQEPEFYGTMPDPLPATLPDGEIVCWGKRWTIYGAILRDDAAYYNLASFKDYRGGGATGGALPAKDIDWSRIPRQPAATRGKLDDAVTAVQGPRAGASSDPYAAVRENERAAAEKTLARDLERRRLGRVAALKLDFDRPSQPKYPESWPERFSSASWEDD